MNDSTLGRVHSAARKALRSLARSIISTRVRRYLIWIASSALVISTAGGAITFCTAVDFGDHITEPLRGTRAALRAAKGSARFAPSVLRRSKTLNKMSFPSCIPIV